MIRAAALRAWAIAALACLGWLLLVAGRVLPSPPHAPADVSTWFDGSDPVLMLAALLRIVSLLLTAWLLAVTLLDLLGLVVRAEILSGAARVLAPAAWRAIVLRPVTLGVLAVPQIAAPQLAVAAEGPSVEAAQVGEVATGSAGHVIVMRHLADGTESEPGLTMRWLPAPRSADAEVVTAQAAAPAPEGPTVVPARPDAGAAAGETHLVRTGENLWSIAEAHLGQANSSRPSQREVAAYWQRLIEANRARLPDPANPGLIYAGIVLELPPPR